ncbi:MAG TPA: DUF1893 domain-containing protein [Bacillota bacterium]|nr:DUF1893 domain-containing protein [Bacillota bacterium]HPP60963.1 DUF1893 domain-containing protein [Bacillota bacterium]
MLEGKSCEQRHEFVNLGRWAQLGEFAFKGSRVEFSIDVARAELSSGWSAVLVNGGEVLDKEKGKGIKPALALVKRRIYEGNLEPHQLTTIDHELVLGDKVLGLAALKLGSLIGCGTMWGELASELAVREGKKRGIQVAYGELVPVILNASGTGLCPMERLASIYDDDLEFYFELCREINL